MKDMIQDVEDFHVKFGQDYSGPPRMLPTSLYEFRTKFHHEEIDEYEEHQEVLEDESRMGEDQDPAVIIDALDKQLDALCDSAFVILGTAYLQFGSDRFRQAWSRVVAANMAKVRADSGVDGCVDSGRDKTHDIVKPPGWSPPDHTDLVRDFAPLGEN